MPKFQVQFHDSHPIGEPCGDCERIARVEASDPLDAAVVAMCGILDNDGVSDDDFRAFARDKSHWTRAHCDKCPSWFLDTDESEACLYPLTVTQVKG